MTLRSVQYDFQQCNMLYIALGNNVATGYNTYVHACNCCTIVANNTRYSHITTTEGNHKI